MECRNCSYLVKWEDMSLITRMMGYSAECSRTGVLFNLEDISATPDWCPFKEEKGGRWNFYI